MARQDIYYDTFTGQFRRTARGDLARHGGSDALKKRIIRRMLSTPGAFTHLPDDYGLGLRVKEPFNQTRVGEIQTNALVQVQQEDEVVQADVEATASAGTLTLTIRARTASGLPISLGMQVTPDGDVIVS